MANSAKKSGFKRKSAKGFTPRQIRAMEGAVTVRRLQGTADPRVLELLTSIETKLANLESFQILAGHAKRVRGKLVPIMPKFKLLKARISKGFQPDADHIVRIVAQNIAKGGPLRRAILKARG